MVNPKKDPPSPVHHANQVKSCWRHHSRFRDFSAPKNTMRLRAPSRAPGFKLEYNRASAPGCDPGPPNRTEASSEVGRVSGISPHPLRGHEVVSGPRGRDSASPTTFVASRLIRRLVGPSAMPDPRDSALWRRRATCLEGVQNPPRWKSWASNEKTIRA